MKKIALLLAMAIAFTSIATATDVAVGGWMDVQGGIQNLSGDANKGNDDPTIYVGSNEFELGVTANGDRFGGRIGLIHWSGQNDGLESAYWVHNTYIYSDFVPGKVRLYGGVTMFPFGNFTSYALVDGAGFGDDAFGLGLGAYNYASYTFLTKKPSGLALELKPIEGLTVLSILDIDHNKEWFKDGANAGSGNKSSLKLEDAVANNMHFNVKYEHEMATVYAGLTTSDPVQADSVSAGVDNAIYGEVSLKVLEGLTSDFKFETLINDVSDDTLNVISANLGYDLGAAKIGSEINFAMKGGDAGLGRSTQDFHMGLAVTPVVPVVNLTLKAAVDTTNEEDAAGDALDATWGIGAHVSKAFGQVNNNLYINFFKQGEDDNLFECKYKITFWF